MKTLEIKVYGFDELSPDAQQVAIEVNRDALVQDDSWFEPILEGFREDMKELGHDIDVRDIRFTGFWSQGNGASFHTKHSSLDTGALLKEAGIKYKDLPRNFSTEVKEGLITYDLYPNPSSYSHENTVELEMEYDGDNDAIYDKCVELVPVLQSMLRDKMRKLYSDLEKYYEELRTDEVIKEELREREEDYLEDGSKFCC